MNEEMFYVGQIFSCKEEVLSFFRKFCRMHSQPLTIRNSSEEKVMFKCCHGRKRRSVSTGQRPNQQYLFKNCTAQVYVGKGKKKYWQVTKADLEHNHEIARVRSRGKRKLDQKGNKLVCEPMEVDDKVSLISKKKDDKFLIRKDILNINNKLFPSGSDDKEAELKNLLIKIAEENGRCMISYDNNNAVKILFLATGVMVDCLRKYQPQVIQIITSFGFDVENYKLLGFCYYSCVTGKSEFAALAIISQETLEVIKQCLEKFKQISVKESIVFLINKDFTGISAIKDVFPFSKILLCKFDVLNYVEKVLSLASACHSATKENVFKMFKKVLDSETEEEYKERKLDLLFIANELEVNAENKCVVFTDLFNNDWDSCKEMWVHCYRKNLPMMEDPRVNRVERSLWTLKNDINTNFGDTLNICESIVGLVDFVDKRLSNSICDMTQKVFKIMSKNAKIRTFLESASLRLNETGLKLLQKSLVSLEVLKAAKSDEKEVEEIFNVYSTNINSCKCEFWKLKQALCQHIILWRETHKTKLCLEDCFHKKYFVTDDSQDNLELVKTIDVEDSGSNTVNISEDKGHDDEILVDGKFKIMSAIMEEINKVVSAQDTQKFWEYIEELKNFLKLVKQGKSVTVTSQSPPSNEAKEPRSPERCVLNKSQDFSLKFPKKMKCRQRLKKI